MPTKINQIQNKVLPRGVMTSSWLERQHISRTEQHKYVKSGWLVRMDKGLYRFASVTPSLYGVLASLREQHGLTYRIGATSALELQGYSHYVPMGKPQAYLFTSISQRLPKWMKEREWEMDCHEFCSKAFSGETGVTKIETEGLALTVSTPELAIMECLLLAPDFYGLMDVYYLMESLTTLRPSVVTELLEECGSFKVKRLFLYMAEKAGHAWFKRIDLDNVTLGSGPRSFGRGGVRVAKYNIIVPKELADYE